MSVEKEHRLSGNSREFFRNLGSGALIGAALHLSRPTLFANDPEGAQFGVGGQTSPILSNKTYRSLEWEDQYPPTAHLDVNWRAAMQATRETGAQCVMVYAKCEWGFAYYPTKIGFSHPHLEGDLFWTEVELAHENGLSTIGYYALGWDNEVGLKHPDWLWRDNKGEQHDTRWYVPCLDSPYRQYVLGMVEEILTNYEIDELLFDDYGIKFHEFYKRGENPLCFCGFTEAAWDREHPDDPYRDGFGGRESWMSRFNWHEKRIMLDFLDEIRAVGQRVRPQCRINLNAHPEILPDRIQEQVSSLYSETIASPTGIALESILIRGWGRPAYQAGFYTSNGYMDTYPGNLGRVKADARLVQNARVFLVGNAPLIPNLDTDGFSKRYMGVAKETFEDARMVDHLLEGIEPLCSTAMLYSEVSTRGELVAQKRPQDFFPPIEGALEALTYSGRPVESAPEFRLTRDFLNQFETFVLPEVEVLTDHQVQLIRNWVWAGGTLLASGPCGLTDENGQARSNFPLADVLGVDYVSEERKYMYDYEGKFKKGFIGVYLRSSGHPLVKLLAASTVGVEGTFLYLKRTTAQEIMEYNLPFMIEHPEDHLWYSEGPPPPGSESGGPAITYNKFGKGQAVYIGVPIFRNVSNPLRVSEMIQDRLIWTRKWIPDLMRQLVTRPIAELTCEPCSQYVHGSFFWEKGKRSILVQVLNTIELATNGELPGSPGVTVWINPDRIKLAAARMLYPAEKELQVGSNNGRTRIVLPKLERYMVLRLALA
jgi:hypothetical protein